MWVVFFPRSTLGRSDHFDLSYIEEGSLVDRTTSITSAPLWKPKGGLWTCPILTPHSWYSWCMDEEPDWLGKEAVLLQIEGVIKCINTNVSWYDNHLKLDQFDMLAFKLPYHLWHSGAWSGWAQWDCDTIWLKNRECIKRGIVIPIRLFDELVDILHNDCKEWLHYSTSIIDLLPNLQIANNRINDLNRRMN